MYTVHATHGLQPLPPSQEKKRETLYMYAAECLGQPPLC